jgi:hypothetical protein
MWSLFQCDKVLEREIYAILYCWSTFQNKLPLAFGLSFELFRMIISWGKSWPDDATPFALSLEQEILHWVK